ncbi:hypothetical protein Bhyg_08984 [Pseudolycoriella hygida]|uniref:Uncharacterized protein n=1 Tax=Pseudolycoriella hygida TaxID=35572 RepID=A0A9Q0N7I1_9DIPT|nr:hypothetical protein Bhyg_08984 [Pseudolycoriella hygida]
MELKSALVLVLLVSTLVILTAADKGCPGNPAECEASCGGPGRGKCEKRWYRWKYQSRCKCNPCHGTLVLGACVDNVEVGVSCNGDGCKPTFG